jgi:hypothetical protein
MLAPFFTLVKSTPASESKKRFFAASISAENAQDNELVSKNRWNTPWQKLWESEEEAAEKALLAQSQRAKARKIFRHCIKSRHP